MAMQVGGDGGDETPISEINTTPLVDVMLVLLIIFLITVPVVVLFIAFQRSFINSIASSGVKG